MMSSTARTVVADNGAYNLRLGFSNSHAPKVIIPNQVAVIRGDGRELVGDETEASTLAHHDLLEYKRAHQRGCLLDRIVEEKVWNRALSQLGESIDEKNKRLLVTEAPAAPIASRKIADELFFEKFKFDHVARILPQSCVVADRVRNHPNDHFSTSSVRIVIDCGYSATWIVPLLDYNPCFPLASKRVDIGGKLLTNLLKEELSWRQVNVMDDTHMVERCKRAVCYVAKDWKNEKPEPLDYLLPDHSVDLEGRIVKPDEVIDHRHRQVMRIAQERINIPEVIFKPMRIGLSEAGIAEAVNQCVSDLPWELRPQAIDNILVTGGTASLPGFVERLESELQEFGCNRGVIDWSGHYQNSAWRGGCLFAESDSFLAVAMARSQYEEDGHYYSSAKQSSKKLKAANKWWSL